MDSGLATSSRPGMTGERYACRRSHSADCRHAPRNGPRNDIGSSRTARLGRNDIQGRTSMRTLLHLSVLPLVCPLSVPASAQLLNQKAIPAAMAITIAQTAIDTCKTNGYAVSVSVVGRSGEVILQVRGDGTGPHTVENSFKKAYTSRTFRSSSGDFAKRLQDNPLLPLIHLSNVVAAQGALPIKAGDDVIGAVGVSGAPGGEKDEVCAKAGIDKVADQLK